MDMTDWPSSCYLSGPAGTGKTVQLEAIAAQALTCGYTVWSADTIKLSPVLRVLSARVDDLTQLVHDSYDMVGNLLIVVDDADNDLRSNRLRTALIHASTRENVDVAVAVRRIAAPGLFSKSKVVSPLAELRMPLDMVED